MAVGGAGNRVLGGIPRTGGRRCLASTGPALLEVLEDRDGTRSTIITGRGGSFRRDGPVSVIETARWTTRSRMASATVG